MPYSQQSLPSINKRKKTKKKPHLQQKNESVQDEIEQQLRRQRQAATIRSKDPSTASKKPRRIGKYVYDDEKQGYFPATAASTSNKRKKPLQEQRKRRQSAAFYPWLFSARMNASASQRQIWLNEWACRLLWKQSSVKSFPFCNDDSSILQLPPLWCRTFQVAMHSPVQQQFWMLQQGQVHLRTVEPSLAVESTVSQSTQDHCYAVRLFENRYKYTLESLGKDTILYQSDLEQGTFQARVHSQGEVYDVLRLSQQHILYSYAGGRLECSGLSSRLPRMSSDVLVLEEYRDTNKNSNNTAAVLMGHRDGTISLWDLCHPPVQGKAPSSEGPVVALQCVSQAVLVQTAGGGWQRYAIQPQQQQQQLGDGGYELVFEYHVHGSGHVRGMAVDPTETVVWCPFLSSGRAELCMYSVATGEYIGSHVLVHESIIRLEVCSSERGVWVRSWNAQGYQIMLFVDYSKK